MPNKVLIDLTKIPLQYTAGSGLDDVKISLNADFVRDVVTHEGNIPIENIASYNIGGVPLEIVQTFPENGSINVNDPTFVFRFNQPVQKTTNGVIRLQRPSPFAVISEFSTASNRVSVQNQTDLVIDLTGLLQSNTTYSLGSYDFATSSPTNFKQTVIASTLRGFRLLVPGSAGSFTFTTGNQLFKKEFSANLNTNFILELGNKITNSDLDRTFLSNQDNSIFSSNPIQLQFASPNVTYTVNLFCNDGEFTYSNATPSSNLDITGTPSQINSILPTIKFYPNVNFASNTQMVVSVSQGAQFLESYNINLLHLGPGSIEEIIIFNTSTTYVPDYKFIKYNAKADIVLAGGGGGGALGGGAAGQVVYQTAVSNLLTQGTPYNIVVGTGGSAGTGMPNSNGANGLNTTAFNYTAQGGSGGSAAQGSINSDPQGGNNASFSGSLGYSGNIFAIPATISYSSGDILGGSVIGGGGAGSFGNAQTFNLSGPYFFEGTTNEFFTPLCGSFLSPSVRGNTGQPATDTSGFDEAPAAGVGRNIPFLNQILGVGGQGVTAYALPRIEVPSTRYFIVWKGISSNTPGSGGAGSLSNDYGILLKFYKRGDSTPTPGQNGIVALRFFRD